MYSLENIKKFLDDEKVCEDENVYNSILRRVKERSTPFGVSPESLIYAFKDQDLLDKFFETTDNDLNHASVFMQSVLKTKIV